MSETIQHETTWAAVDRALLDVALAALPPTVAVGPVVTVEWGGTTSYAARLSTTVAPFGPPPAGIREEVTPAAGVFMQGPQLPPLTPARWLDRVDRSTQAAMLAWIEQQPSGRLLALRFASLPAVNVTDLEIRQIVAGMQAAKVITDEQAAALLV